MYAKILGKCYSKTLTCCFMLTFSNEDFLVKLDRKDKGKTKAALPTRTSANSIELTPIDFPGLRKGKKEKKLTLYNHLSGSKYLNCYQYTYCLQLSTFQYPRHPCQHKER